MLPIQVIFEMKKRYKSVTQLLHALPPAGNRGASQIYLKRMGLTSEEEIRNRPYTKYYHIPGTRNKEGKPFRVSEDFIRQVYAGVSPEVGTLISESEAFKPVL